ncbi:hypothetical protein BC940DRAFT_371214 [Gongronella butleri]|nr:hypothetical protein BC940DRAFT_371214 [Gongronella butleri]
MKTAVLALIATAICLLDQAQAAPIASVAHGTGHLERRGGDLLGGLAGGSGTTVVGEEGSEDALNSLGKTLDKILGGASGAIKRRDGLGGLLGGDGDNVTKREVKSKKVNFARAHAAMKKVNKEMVATYKYGKAHYPAGHQLAGHPGIDLLSGVLKTVFELLDGLLGGALKSGPSTATNMAGGSSTMPGLDVGANDVTPGDASNVVSSGNNDPPPDNSDHATDAPQESPDPDTQPETLPTSSLLTTVTLQPRKLLNHFRTKAPENKEPASEPDSNLRL